MEDMSIVLPFVLVFAASIAFAGLSGKLKQRQKQAGRQPGVSFPQESRAPEEESPKPAAPAFDQHHFTTFARPYETDASGWDSGAEFHEGEDPCHDDMETLAPEGLRASDPAPDPKMQELVRGFVIGEVLSRRKNGVWQRR